MSEIDSTQQRRISLPLPRKGTETLGNAGKRRFSRISLPLPRKGTETASRDVLNVLSLTISLPLPRKGTETYDVAIVCMQRELEFHYLFPARGRKLGVGGLDTGPAADFMTSSPQGDGNICSGCQVGCVTKITRLRRERTIDLPEEK